jgi:hypothetical protein
MSHPVITAKEKLLDLLAALDFAGNGAVTPRKLDVFEKPGASVSLQVLESQRLANEGHVERTQALQVTLVEWKENVSGTPIEEVVFGLGSDLEAAIYTAEQAGEFPEGLEIHLARQIVEELKDDPNTGILTQIYTIDYTENLTPT